ncbi:hypothetical protein SD81_012800 [Tolypothrix campylonemoides VB511288]|nr:hypothetical protein SD81_012800 [Tolypothrix campylonemoides VB511288]
MKNTLFDKIFRDSDGNIVLAQMPNLPLIIWITASLLKLVFTTGLVNTGLDALAFGSLFTWAWLELFQLISCTYPYNPGATQKQRNKVI